MNNIVVKLTLILVSLPIALTAMLVWDGFLHAAEPPRSIQTTANKSESKYQYADGAGNLYIIAPESIEYRPVSRAESSSGNYDGGTPRTVKINARQYREIVVALDRAFNSRSNRVENASMGRAKGTGLIYKRLKNRQIQTQVIAQNSPERREIETLLKQSIGDN
jgi:hypothetical protein